MEVGSHEFYKVMEQFERDYSSIHPKREQVSVWKYEAFYTNEANKLFLAYLNGYLFRKNEDNRSVIDTGPPSK